MGELTRLTMGESALPSFLQREELKDQNNDVPVAFLAISALVVIGAVGYAVRYLQAEQAEETQRKNDQTQKRAARKAKKGKSLTDADTVTIDENSSPLEAIKQAVGFVLSLIKDVLVVAVVVVIVIEGWRWLPRVTVVPCSDVLGRTDDGSKCVVNAQDTWLPRLEDPLECAHASRPAKGEMPTFEQHVLRNCYAELPSGVLRPSQRYSWDSAGTSWYPQAMMSSLFYRPWLHLSYLLPNKEGGASIAIVAKSFEGQLTAFYATHNYTAFQDAEKIRNIVNKHSAIKTADGRVTFAAKTMAALHTKYKTGLMGAQISPIENGIDCAGVISGPFQFVVPRSMFDKWSHFVTDFLPEMRYLVTTSDF